MASVKVTSNLPEWLQSMFDERLSVADAAVAALRETATNAVEEGRRDIAGAGRFSGKWLTGLRYKTKDATDEKGNSSMQAQAIIYHSKGLAAVFEFGAVIQGRPLLWIPTTPGGPAPKKSGKKLMSATVRGQPMLFDAGDKDRHRKPLYVGVPQVSIRKRFHIREIAIRHTAQIGRLFIKYYKG